MDRRERIVVRSITRGEAAFMMVLSGDFHTVVVEVPDEKEIIGNVLPVTVVLHAVRSFTWLEVHPMPILAL